MTRSELIALARELYATHGLLPVPVAGKTPIGGTGWNTLPLETRISNVNAYDCTGVGIQMGLIFHPVLGPKEARAVDCDIDDRQKSMLFANSLRSFFPIHHWRWGRRPATLVFTEPGIIQQEKFGPVQLLGNGKQIVWDGVYQNKSPLLTDPREYWHEGPSIFEALPPVVPALLLRTALESSLFAAGIPVYQKSMLIDAVPLTEADIAMLTPQNFAQFQSEVKSMLFDVQSSPIGSGRGTKLHHLGIKYGALIKASGHASVLTDAAQKICPFDKFVEFAIVNNPVLAEIGMLAEQAFEILPGTLGAGDRRDFARGVGMSMGLGQSIAVYKAKHAFVMPSGRGYAGQTADALMRENLAPLRYLVPKFLADSGCIVLAGKPKIGKGWIILELGLSVAEGGLFWGEQCEQGEVLMYMLEDNKRRVKERIGMLRPNGFVASNSLRFRYSVDGPFFVNADGTGTLLDDIRAHLRQFPNIRLVVVDVLQRVRGTVERSDNAYQIDYKVIGAIQKLATENNVLIIVVHHVKKGKVDDAIDSINGSFGVIGAADGGIIIGKEGDIVRCESRMRDIPDFEFELTKESGSPMWKPGITVTELSAPSDGTKTHNVVVALHAAACALTAGDIAKRTGISEKNVATYLGRLLKSEQITRTSRGFYMAANLPYRERLKGVIDILRRCPKTVATTEIKEQYAPNSAPPEATYMILTDVAIKEIEAGFVNGKDALQSLKHRGMATFNNDTVWLIGDFWGTPRQPVQQPNPFSIRMPWELLQ